MDLLEDRSAVITGGAQGLGRAIADGSPPRVPGS